MRLSIVLCLLGIACSTAPNPEPDDLDGDGYPAAEDCDDTDPAAHPGATEVCDTVDNDCDGRLDLDAVDATTWYADTDDDGHGDPAVAVTGCTLAPGYSDLADDCDDTDAARFPGNPELCNELDEDCDDEVDEGAIDAPTWYGDSDGDRYGLDDDTLTACVAPPGYVPVGGDCDDTSAAWHPNAPEEDCADPNDYNCDGSVGFADADHDGSPACEDCDDTDAARSPALSEVCDELDRDEDCDSLSDDADDVDAATRSTWWPDDDGDRYGDAGGTAVPACDAPLGFVADTTDCDDTRADVHPGAAEVCDALDADEDCDTLRDDTDPSVDSAGFATWWIDADADGYGEASASTAACDAPAGYAADATDCDDADPSVSPGALELCDAADLDEDCDGLSDDDDAGALGTATHYADADADGWGDAAASVDVCDVPPGFVTVPGDCDDADADTFPGVAADESSTACMNDDDGDGWGDATASGAVAAGSDCDDGDAAVSPAAIEDCGTPTTDDDCDGVTNEDGALACATWYADADADGHGTTTSACLCEAAGTYTATSTDDCDDGDAGVSPSDTEVCDDSLDNDCDGAADEDCALLPFGGDYTIEAASSASSEADAILYGEAAIDEFGQVMASGADLDGDGADDLVVGADGNAYGAYLGSVYVYSGMPSGVAEADSAAVARVYGSSTTNTFPEGVSLVPDMDGDGYAELAIRRTYGTSRAVYLYEGEDLSGTAAYNASAWMYDDFALSGPIIGLGAENATTGNDDVGVVDSAANSNQGALYVYTYASTGLSPLATINGEDATDYAGVGVAGGTDTNADGYDDIFLGAYGDDSGGTNAGAAYVVEAPVTSTYDLSSAPIKIVGDANDSLGYRVAAPGDVDGDGHADMLVGAPADDGGRTNAGAVYLFEDVDTDGSTKDNDDGDYEAVVWGAGVTDGLGTTPIAAGDVNGDGEVDLLVGSPLYDLTGSEGGAWVIYGPLAGSYDLASSSDHDARFLGNDASDQCGASVAIGDLQADGAAEVLIGCTAGDVDGKSARGSVYIFEGR